MKKIFLILLSFVLLSACSALSARKGGESLLQGQTQVSLVDVVDGKNEYKRHSKSEFELGKMIYLYSAIGWSPESQAKNIEVRWRNAHDQVVTVQHRQPIYARDPHHVWFWINSAQLGKGEVSVDFLLDGELAHHLVFNVVDAQKQSVEPWYKRILNHIY